MTRFCWWTVTWFGLNLASRIVMFHYMGWAGYKAEYDDNVRAGASLCVLAGWLVLWFTIVKKEP